MVKLGVTVPLGKCETATSFASRLAARNRKPNVLEFCTDVGLNFRAIITGKMDEILRLAELGGADPRLLAASSLVHAEPKVWTLNGERLYGRSIRTSFVSVCHECIKEDITKGDFPPDASAYARAIWIVDALRTCPIHNRPLQRLNRARLNGSLAGDFARAFRANWSALEDTRSLRRTSDLEKYVVARVDGHSAPGAAFLDSMGLGAAIRGCEMFGAVAIDGALANIDAYDDARWHAAGSEGYRLFEGGKEALKAFLTKLSDEVPRGGPSRALGRVYSWLLYTRDKDIEPLRDIVADYILDRYPVGPGATVFGKAVKERRAYSIGAAAREHSMPYHTVRSILVAAGLVPKGARPAKNGLAFLDPAQVNSLLERAARGVLASQAASHLAMPYLHFLAMTKARLIEPIVRGSGTDHTYHPKDLDQLLERLLEKAVPITDRPAGCVSIVEFVTDARRGIARTASLVLDGRLSWVGRDIEKRGYESVLIMSAEAKALLDPAQREDNVFEQAKRLGLNRTSVAGLVRLGYLETTTIERPSRKKMKIMTNTQIDRFHSRFVTLKELKQGVPGIDERDNRSLRLALLKRGVEPLADALAVGAIIFRRSDLL